MSSAGRMRPTQLQTQLLRAALHPDIDVARAAAQQWSANVDLDTLDFASLMQLPVLSARSDDLRIETPLAKQIGRVSRMTWLKTETLAHAVAPAIAELQQAGLRPMLMKGAAMVYAHGAPVRSRPMFDIDLLVDPVEVPEAVRILAGLGYKGNLERQLQAGDERCIAMCHSCNFLTTEGADVDLHWTPVHALHRPELLPALRERAVPARLSGVECEATGVEDTLMITIAHAADHWRDMRERWVADCTQLIRGREAELDWELITARARDWRIARQTLDAIDCLREIAGVATPPAARRRLARSPVPLAVRMRRAARDSANGFPPPSGRLLRVLGDYEADVIDHVAPGARTGPLSFAAYLGRRWGVESLPAVAGEALFTAAGRPWRTRRRMLGDRTAEAAAPPYRLGEKLLFHADVAPLEYLGAGWWFPETWWVWSRGALSQLSLGLEEETATDAELVLGFYVPIRENRPSVQIDVVVNQQRITRFETSEESQIRAVRIPAATLAGRRRVDIAFVVRDPIVQSEYGIAYDPREVGIGLSELTLTRVAGS